MSVSTMYPSVAEMIVLAPATTGCPPVGLRPQVGSTCRVFDRNAHWYELSDGEQTSIATGLVSSPLPAAGHSVDPGVGPRWLAPAGARGRDVHTSRPIHR